MRIGWRSRRAGRPWPGAVVALAVTVLAACGVGVDDEPRAIPNDNLPANIQDEAGGPSVTESPVSGQTVAVYFIMTREGGEALQAIERAADPTPAGALDALLQQRPNDQEQDDGIVTRIPSNTTLLEPPSQDEDGVLHVNLSEDIYTVQGEGATFAWAQLVFTATETGGVNAVLFRVEGEPASALDGEGTEVTDRAVTRRDYVDLASNSTPIEP